MRHHSIEPIPHVCTSHKTKQTNPSGILTLELRFLVDSDGKPVETYVPKPEELTTVCRRELHLHRIADPAVGAHCAVELALDPMYSAVVGVSVHSAMTGEKNRPVILLLSRAYRCSVLIMQPNICLLYTSDAADD